MTDTLKDWQLLYAAMLAAAPTPPSTGEVVAQRLWVEGSDESNLGWFDYDEVDASQRLKEGYVPLYAAPTQRTEAAPSAPEQEPDDWCPSITPAQVQRQYDKLIGAPEQAAPALVGKTERTHLAKAQENLYAVVTELKESTASLAAALERIVELEAWKDSMQHGVCGGFFRGDPIRYVPECVEHKDTIAELENSIATVRKLASEDAMALQVRIAELEAALRFYADGSHFMLADEDAWYTVSGEPTNFWCDEAGTATVEDGTVAKMALAGTPLPDELEDDRALLVQARDALELLQHEHWTHWPMEHNDIACAALAALDARLKEDGV